jgi:hypothetical protein
MAPAMLCLQGNAMHLFEALTILLAGQLTLALAVIGGGVPRGTYLLPLACLAPLALHLAFEGVRWQMAPVYLVVAAICLFGVLRYRRASAPRRARIEAPRRARIEASRRARVEAPRRARVEAPRGGAILPRLLGIVGFLLLMVSVAVVIAWR